MFDFNSIPFTPLRPLPKNGKIAITSPASTPDSEKLKLGVHYLESRGYQVEIGSSCFAKKDYLAGDDALRADELLNFIERDDIDAIFCSRGGFGSMKLLRMLDYELIKEKRKLLVGFSDITSLLLGIYAQTGIGGISGMMPTYHFSNPNLPTTEETQFWNLVENGQIDFELKPKLDSFQPIENQLIEGRALAGTLSLITKLLGTPFFPSLANHILFLEDIGEPMHKLEGYFEHFQLSGHLQTATALVFGEFTPSDKEEYSDIPTQKAVLQRVFRTFRRPLFTGMNYGHIPNLFSVPIGLPVSIEMNSDTTVIRSTQSLFE